MPTSNSQIKFIPCTKSEYSNLPSASIDDNALYFITDEYKIYVGSNEYTKSFEIISETPTTSTAGIDNRIYYCSADQTLYYCSHPVNAGLYSWTKISNLGMVLAPEANTSETIAELPIGQLFRSQGEIALKTGSGSTYTQLAKTSSIPSKTSQLQNDSGFLTQHQDISGKMNLAPDISPNEISSLSDGQLFRSTGAIALKVGNASDYIEIAKSVSLNTKENTSNKVTSISSSSTDTQYPSAKCVYDSLKYYAVELTYDNNNDTYVADKTVKEIYDAVVANKEIVIYYTEFGGDRETRFNVGHARYSSDTNDYTIYIYCLHYLANGNVWKFVATGSATSTTGAVFNQITT